MILTVVSWVLPLYGVIYGIAIMLGRVRFVPRDIWIGVYFEHHTYHHESGVQKKDEGGRLISCRPFARAGTCGSR